MLLLRKTQTSSLCFFLHDNLRRSREKRWRRSTGRNVYSVSTRSDAVVIIDHSPDLKFASSSQKPAPSYRLEQKNLHMHYTFFKNMHSRHGGPRHYQLIHSITASPTLQCTNCLVVKKEGTTGLSTQFVPVHNHTYKQSGEGV